MAYGNRQYVNDGREQPRINGVELRRSMKIVYDHMHNIRKVDRETLLTALDKMAEGFMNENWVLYVP